MAITSLLKKGEKLDADVQLLSTLTTGTAGTLAVTFPNLKEVFWAHLEVIAGYYAAYTSKSGNVVTFTIYGTGTGSGVALSALSTATIATGAVAVGIGRK